MTKLTVFIQDCKVKGYIDQDKLIAALSEQAAHIKSLEERSAGEPYKNPEAH